VARVRLVQGLRVIPRLHVDDGLGNLRKGGTQALFDGMGKGMGLIEGELGGDVDAEVHEDAVPRGAGPQAVYVAHPG